NADLDALAAQRGLALQQWQEDLSQPAHAAERLAAWMASAQPGFGGATLINNAGLISRLGPVDETPLAELSAALRVGLEACLLLSSAFLRASRAWPGPRRILNISSGLGRHAMAASAAYCAAKAGMDHLSTAMAMDEALKPNGARIVSLAPGVIDTDMQQQLRNGESGAFPGRERFVSLHEQGQLATPAQAAARVLAYLERADFGAKVVADVRES
ncbi:MAG: SDR family NAD(P)-dependent oxidoreductase, partial [Burkholderiaceae bacterium]|nr:SDR family NAD(P)-dependent oxidoreductase [Burkholderiaceae bacterium]